MSEFLLLLQRAREGDAGAWDELVKRYRPLLCRAVERILPQGIGRHIDASDLAQETFLDVRKSLSTFRGQAEQEWLAWLFRVSRCNIEDAIRRHQQAQRRADSDTAISDSATDLRVRREKNSDANSPSGIMRQKELQAAVREACRRLPEDLRVVVQLRYIEKCPVKEIAFQMNKTPAAVAGLLQRAVKRLQILLQDHSLSAT